MKMTTIEMDWTDDGARIKYDATSAGSLILPSISCPRCAVVVAANSGAHLCGDRAPKPPKAVRRTRRVAVRNA